MIYPRCKPVVRGPLTLEEAMHSPSPNAKSGTNSPQPQEHKSRANSNSPVRYLHHSASKRATSPGKDDIFLKSRVDQSIHLMKLIYETAGEPVRPGGHSQFDALGTLKSDMAFKVLNKKRWADFFEDIKEKSGLDARETSMEGGIGTGKMGADQSQFASTSLMQSGPSMEELQQEKLDSSETFRTMKKRVVQLWKDLRIPRSDVDFYSYNLLRSCNGTIEQFNDIARYIVVLSNYRGSTMAVLEEVHNREFAVVNLLDCLSQIKRRSSVDEFKPRLLTCIQHVQISTINTIHQIQNWRANFWRPLPFRFRGENYLLRMQSDVDALKTESLGAILRDCGICPSDLLCVLFALENLILQTSEDQNESTVNRLVSAVPLPALHEASAVVQAEAELQRQLRAEREQLTRDGVFIPMLRYEHSLESSTKISGGMVPQVQATVPIYHHSLPNLDDSGSRLGQSMSQATESSSRIDV